MKQHYTQTQNLSLPRDARAALSEFYLKDESELVKTLLAAYQPTSEQNHTTTKLASKLVTTIRSDNKRAPLIDAFLQEYGLSTDEGIILMRLAESLIRTPDKANAYALIRDKIEPGQWSDHRGDSPSMIVDVATLGLGMTKSWIRVTGGKRARHLAAKMGDYALYLAIFRVMQLMGNHYVLGKDIEAAIKTASDAAGPQDCYSFDMLGEAAHTQADADRYFEAYRLALNAIADHQSAKGFRSGQAGLSVKLSALHPRYELTQREKCVPHLVSKLSELAHIAKAHDLNITIDAEEADRLELSLIILEKLSQIETLGDWNGLGFVVQAYQRRALPVIDHLITLYKNKKTRLNIRLVKGAYWDSEIKRAQELGLASYPVFTRKENTDLSYLACAKRLLEAPEAIYPRFATHNAHTAAAIMTLAGKNQNYEFQRLHGMGKELHELLKSVSGVNSRVYAPVGAHEDLLPYLVRRLLENGANSSFVNQLTSDEVSIADIIEDPREKARTNGQAPHPKIHAPRDHFSGRRLAAPGIDITQSIADATFSNLIKSYKPVKAHSLIEGKKPRKPLGRYPLANPSNAEENIGEWAAASTASIDKAIAIAKRSEWGTRYTAQQRKEIINKIGHQLGTHRDLFLTLCVKEAGKTWQDAIAEIREAIDFCHYYANQVHDRASLGVVACISPWNFPLAIFLGQIVGALAAGNSVICKPAEQTPLIAFEAIKLLHKAGVPKSALHLILGDGGELGTHLSAHPGINGICFTGSTATAQKIAAKLVETHRAHIPLIAETGGLNAMIVDSTALLEQVVSDVISSAFQSAGQRCSACRIVCVQDEIADDFIEMLSGSMQELTLSAPQNLSTDIGPVIDEAARDMLQSYITTSKSHYRVLHEIPQNGETAHGSFIGPIAFEIPDINVLEKEIFGPVLHIVRFKEAELNTLIETINALGYGLTMGLHTRIDDRITEVSKRACVGNLYVNRNQIGAVVGVQPFGGEGLSGTGPKAGGPFYVRRLSRPKAIALPVPTQSSGYHIKAAYDESLNLSVIQKASKLWFNQKDDAQFERVAEICQTILGPAPNGFLSKLRTPHKVQTDLPGPTGERNSLSLTPRGLIVCDGDASKDVLLRQVLTLLSTGNAGFIYSPDEKKTPLIEKLCAALREATGQDHLISYGSAVPFGPENILALGAIQTTADRVNDWADWALSLKGHLVPVLTPDDEMERFFLERTLSINTTAAGGNATLLAM